MGMLCVDFNSEAVERATRSCTHDLIPSYCNGLGRDYNALERGMSYLVKEKEKNKNTTRKSRTIFV